MTKSALNTHDLTEADFRKLQILLEKRFGKRYTTDYIRKVWNKKRTNARILNMSERYQKIKAEMEQQIERLTLQNEFDESTRPV